MTFFATDCAPACPICESTCCGYYTRERYDYPGQPRAEEIKAECAACKNVSFFSCPVDVDDAHGIRLVHEKACVQPKALRGDWIDDAREAGKRAAIAFAASPVFKRGYRSDVIARFVTSKRNAGMHEGDVRTLASAFREGFKGETSAHV